MGYKDRYEYKLKVQDRWPTRKIFAGFHEPRVTTPCKAYVEWLEGDLVEVAWCILWNFYFYFNFSFKFVDTCLIKGR
jgi:hypothetical protein